MRKSLGQIVGVSAVSLALLVGTYGCAGGARDGANRGGDTARPGGGAAAGQGAGGVGANQAGAGAGGMQAGLTPGGGANQAAQVDLGQQISDAVARIDGLGTMGAGTAGVAGADGAAGGQAGGAAQRNIGVSTLVVTNVALVGIDAATLGGGDTAGMQERVRSQVTAAYPQIADVLVTTDPELVYRIARMAASVQRGTSMAGQMAEVAAIAREMTLPNANDRDALPDANR